MSNNFLFLFFWKNIKKRPKTKSHKTFYDSNILKKSINKYWRCIEWQLWCVAAIRDVSPDTSIYAPQLTRRRELTFSSYLYFLAWFSPIHLATVWLNAIQSKKKKLQQQAVDKYEKKSIGKLFTDNIVKSFANSFPSYANKYAGVAFASNCKCEYE